MQHLIKKEIIINPVLLASEKNYNLIKILQIFEKINKAKKHICKEVFSNIFQYMYWKELNIIDIEPINIMCSILLLQKLLEYNNKLFYLMLISDNKKAIKYKEYIIQHLKVPISFTIIDNEIETDEFSDKIKEIRETANQNMLFFLSTFSKTNKELLHGIYKNLTFKDYLLMLIPIYNKDLVKNINSKIEKFLSNSTLSYISKEWSIKAGDGEWEIGYFEPFFEVNFILKKDKKINNQNSIILLEKGTSLNLIKYYIPAEEKIFSLLQQYGFEVINSFNEQTTSLSILLCKKTKSIKR